MFDVETLIKTVGLLGVWAIVYAESGLMVGFFLPGDSLLFTAGFLASQGFFPIEALVAGCFVAAVLGDNTGYWLGRRWGRRLFQREDSIWFHRDHAARAEEFYRRHGPKTIIIARFVPIVRAFAPVVAGIGAMRYPVFLAFDLIGGLLWAVGVTVLGYVLGQTVPDIDRYLLPIIAAIIVVSLAPNVIHLLRDPSVRRQLSALLQRRPGA